MDSTPRSTFGSLIEAKGLNSFDLLRLLFAAMVIFSHAYDLTGAGRDSIFRWTHHQTTAGGLAVTGFFVISGFLITGSWIRSGSFVQYMSRRICRIVPGFTAAVIFSFLIAGPLGSSGVRAYFSDPTAYRFLELLAFKGPQIVATTLRDCPFSGNLNGSLWTIRLEATCYVAVAIAGGLGLLRHAPLTIVAAGATVALGRLAGVPTVHRHLNIFLCGLAMYAPAFAVGSAFFILRDRIYHSLSLLVASLLILVVTAQLGCINYALLICGTYAILYLGLVPARPWTQVSRYGDFSYGVYLYAFPVQQLVVHFGSVGPLLNMAVALPITLVLAVLSWHFVERPFLRRTSRPAPNPSEAAPIPVGNALVLPAASL